MKAFLRNIIPDRHPLRLLYHKGMAMMAAFYYRFPASELEVVAITGTNGKTSTSTYLHHLFMTAGKKAGLLSTVQFKIGEDTEINYSKQTTVSPWVMQKKLRQMVEAECKVAVIEATSHAMIQSRLWGINVDTAVFTNLTEDHYEYHGGADAYRQAKGLLFQHLNSSQRKPGIDKVSVVNQDDPSADYFNSFPADVSYPYGIEKGIYVGRNLELNSNGTKFTLKVPNGELEINFPIPGKMNVYNAVAAAAVAMAHKVNPTAIKTGLESMLTVPGRIEVIKEGQPFTAIVDYAHSEDSMEQLLSMFRDLTKGQLIVAFGSCGGGRDKAKRPRIGAIVHKYANTIIITDDDPYDEDPRSIADMLRQGIPREEGNGLWQVLNRKEAIRLALSLAKTSDDTVIVAGKGAEPIQVIATGKIPHDDRQVVREYLSRTVDIEVPS